jgi:hypothetical protein
MRALIPKSKTKGKQKKQYLKLIQLVSAHPEIKKPMLKESHLPLPDYPHEDMTEFCEIKLMHS